VQVFAPAGQGTFTAVRTWDVVAWYGQSLNNKPSIVVDSSGNLYISDPEGYRLLRFSSNGDFVNYWGDYGVGPAAFNLPSGMAVDPAGGLWVADSGNHRVMHFMP
jgi:DNA-binding beta-propeller fold protein YncE